MSQGSRGSGLQRLATNHCRFLEVAALLKHDWLFCFFNQFLKLRVVTQRIPKRHQFQLAIAEVARATEGNSKLFASEIFVTERRRDHRQILDHHVATDLIFFYWKKLDRAPAFAQCFLSPAETGVDQTKHAQRRPVIWLSLDDFLLLRAGSDKSGPRSILIFRYASDDAFYKWTIKKNILGRTKGDWTLTKRG